MSEVINVKKDGIQFALCEDGTAIVKEGKKSLTGDLVIPPVVEHDGKAYHVVEVADMAFMGCSALENITLPEGIHEIGMVAFSLCVKLKNIILPDSVCKIGSGVFSLCTALTTVSLPKGLTEIEEKMFTGSLKLGSVSIPGSVAKIKADAFNGCMSLKWLYSPGTRRSWTVRVVNPIHWKNALRRFIIRRGLKAGEKLLEVLLHKIFLKIHSSVNY